MKDNPVPRFRSASFYGKTGSITAAVIVNFYGALPRASASSKEQNKTYKETKVNEDYAYTRYMNEKTNNQPPDKG